MKAISGNIIASLLSFANDERKKSNEWFFKTGKGQYGEGDQFIGVRMPDCRYVAKQFKGVDFSELKKLISDPIHEVRMCALLILVGQYKEGQQKKEVLDFYLAHKKYVNNWDLVDISAHYILGQAILDGIQDESILQKLRESKSLWDRRIAIVSTWIMIRSGNIQTTLDLAEKLLSDPEDLMHKAVGWMLREAWKKDSFAVEEFLIKHYSKIPRTTLRYAIERIEEGKRTRFLKGDFEKK